MDVFVETLRAEWARVVALSPRIVIALVVLAASFLLGSLVSRSLVRILERGGAPSTYRQFFSGLVRWIVVLIGVVAALDLLGLRHLATGLVAGGGVMAVVLGFAFRGVGENFLAGFFLVLGRTFRVNDVIQSGEFQGTVREIALRYTHIRAADGRDIFIPSYDIFSKPLVNYTRDGLRRFAFSIGLDYADDLERAREILVGVVDARDAVLDDPAPGVRIAAFEANYVVLDVFFWLDTFSRGLDMVTERTRLMDACRRALLDGGFTVSSEVSTNVSLRAPDPVPVETR